MSPDGASSLIGCRSRRPRRHGTRSHLGGKQPEQPHCGGQPGQYIPTWVTTTKADEERTPSHSSRSAPSTTGTSVSTSSATEDIVAAMGAAMAPMVNVLTDAVTLDTVATTGRIHKLPTFNGTKQKWPNRHWSLKLALGMPFFAPGGDWTLVTTTANAAQSKILHKLIQTAVQGQAVR